MRIALRIKFKLVALNVFNTIQFIEKKYNLSLQ